ncbi:hypothetical protein U6N30_04515 [Blastococcus brunescens]|uniref:Uncharacterized protein n=1 Tax=Blastococcus brunescens TaxID=1564165 RepID=A0ABZ1B3N0_9ACTN|nr:hypothetical protein [Blastococcus sp. BMG 8361]WRL64982.1 hypothetical protein U6N30_04515 [Blastococcus sp. BMG 8361]
MSDFARQPWQALQATRGGEEQLVFGDVDGELVEAHFQGHGKPKRLRS